MSYKSLTGPDDEYYRESCKLMEFKLDMEDGHHGDLKFSVTVFDSAASRNL